MRGRSRGWLLLVWSVCGAATVGVVVEPGVSNLVGAFVLAFVGSLAGLGAYRWLGTRHQRKGDRLLEPLLARAVEETADSVVITDRSGSIVYANPAFERISGYAAGEVIGQNPRLLKGGEIEPATYRTLWRTIAGGGIWRGRFVNRRKDGTRYELEQTIAPMPGPDGAPGFFVAVGRDVTLEGHLRAQLLQAQKMEAIGRLAGGIAHDFNNLLAVILSYTGFVLEELEEGSQARDDAREVEHAARRAADLTRRLLLLSRKEEVLLERIELSALVEDLGKILRRVLGEDVRLEARKTPDIWPVKADRTQLEQVLMNLAVNARDAMEGGGTLRICVRNLFLDAGSAARQQLAPGRWVRLSVQDDGCGMSPEVQAQAFDPFFTTKSREKGTGLGLATVLGIVTRAGGHVQVESAVGRGTTIHVLLPAADEPAPAAGAHQAVAQRLRGTERILLVEDDDAVRGSLLRSLEANGYRVQIAASVAEAGEAAGPFDLILTDVILPDGNALEVAARWEGLPITYMSGYTDDLLRETGLRLGEVDLLRKPFGEHELLARLRCRLDPAEAGPAGTPGSPGLTAAAGRGDPGAHPRAG